MKSVLPQYTVILNPIDGSRASDLATLHAVYLAKLSGAELMPVFVVDESLARSAGVSEPVATEQLTKKGRAVLASATDIAEQSGISATPLLVKGQTALTIVDLARDRGATLIVMGGTAFQDIDRLLAHPVSISEGVLRGAPCPVLVVRGPQ